RTASGVCEGHADAAGDLRGHRQPKRLLQDGPLARHLDQRGDPVQDRLQPAQARGRLHGDVGEVGRAGRDASRQPECGDHPGDRVADRAGARLAELRGSLHEDPLSPVVEEEAPDRAGGPEPPVSLRV
ncbi:hypothetical protein ABE10_00405, partial [Bacillus toyonensis]|nr:hypothetical protein [Bacillus toyonensis]